LDLENAVLFGNQTAVIQSLSRHSLTSKSKIKEMEREDQGLLCKKELQFQMELKLMAGDKAGAKGIKKILKAEETKEIQRQLKWAMPRTDAGITAVRVPTDGDYSTDHCKKCNSWQTLDDPTEVQEALQHRNQVHFGQADGTFPTSPQFTDHIHWMASTIMADMILNGEDPFKDFDILDIARELLASFAHSSPLHVVSDEVTLEEWTGKMKFWKETTSTSPSGMHLGHHKTLIKPFHPENPPVGTPPELLELEAHRQDIAQAQVDWLNLAIKNQYTYKRWHNVVNFLHAKEPGIPRCHKLRVIHLYEADHNALIGIKWRQLIHHVTDNRLLSPWQCRAFPGREAHTPVLLEELPWEITRTSRRPLLHMDFDASSCYDRIIPSLSSLVSRSYGQHRKTCFIHGRFLCNTKLPKDKYSTSVWRIRKPVPRLPSTEHG
jgi:hypothetical protein